ncbi:hypothetical protein KOI35_25520 [Actinoplanes bogorensis]|uniref:Uncharacterized protein n=1 Tax=Paractinoplanes bogorensis TaxID=1610840 RepID=A0ABS5YTX0_9ACTN|nr:hypothetical protein [Actinoplanes bogorensis]MBU2666875.1 hypothetical protein [Actinoplanes bogorensis]
MEPTTYAEVAGMVAWFGVLGMVVAGLALIAVKVVRADEVPAYVRGRIQWWTAHNAGFMLGGLVLAVAGLIGAAAL